MSGFRGGRLRHAGLAILTSTVDQGEDLWSRVDGEAPDWMDIDEPARVLLLEELDLLIGFIQTFLAP